MSSPATESRLSRPRRAAAMLVRDPLQAVDRLRNKLEFRREAVGQRELSRTEVREQCRALYGYEVDDDWERKLHALIGAEWPCSTHSLFEPEWSALMRELPPGPAQLGSGLDADPALARTGLCLVRRLRPRAVVETGVARGIHTRFLLHGLHVNRFGQLWSIDLQPLRDGWHEHAAIAVPDRLRERWTFLRGSSRRRLPGLLADLGEIDMFVHDSQHTERNMRFEIALAWRALRPGGVLVADDIHENAAFQQFTAETTDADWVIGQEEIKSGLFGLAVKRSA